MNLQISPGTCNMSSLCSESFGALNIKPTLWGEPITVIDVHEEDIDAFIELVQEIEKSEFDGPVFKFTKYD